MQTKGVKETFQHIHHQQDTKSDTSKDSVSNEGGEPVDVECREHSLFPEDSGQLGVSKRKGPETQVGSSVGNHTQDEFNGFNGLVNNNLAKSVFFIFVVASTSVTFLGIVVVLDGSVVLLGKEVRLGKEEDGHSCKGTKKKDILDTSLAAVHGFVHSSRVQGDVDQSSDKIGRLTTISGSSKVKRTLVGSSFTAITAQSPRCATESLVITLSPFTIVCFTAPCIAVRVDAGGRQHSRVPVDRPLVHDEENHVNEQRSGKDNHGNEFIQKVERLLEVNGIQPL